MALPFRRTNKVLVPQVHPSKKVVSNGKSSIGKCTAFEVFGNYIDNAFIGVKLYDSSKGSGIKSVEFQANSALAITSDRLVATRMTFRFTHQGCKLDVVITGDAKAEDLHKVDKDGKTQELFEIDDPQMFIDMMSLTGEKSIPGSIVRLSAKLGINSQSLDEMVLRHLSDSLGRGFHCEISWSRKIKEEDRIDFGNVKTIVNETSEIRQVGQSQVLDAEPPTGKPVMDVIAIEHFPKQQAI